MRRKSAGVWHLEGSRGELDGEGLGEGWRRVEWVEAASDT